MWCEIDSFTPTIQDLNNELKQAEKKRNLLLKKHHLTSVQRGFKCCNIKMSMSCLLTTLLTWRSVITLQYQSILNSHSLSSVLQRIISMSWCSREIFVQNAWISILKSLYESTSTSYTVWRQHFAWCSQTSLKMKQRFYTLCSFNEWIMRDMILTSRNDFSWEYLVRVLYQLSS
jgi:hypothetical protein